ncbi:MAG: HAD-IA family hydrolase [Draconibacterium sp.]|nr:HAD-IA family hydrolase [Draconibacterium sp.]
MIKAITFDLWDTVFIDDSDEPKRKAAGRLSKKEERRALVLQYASKHKKVTKELVESIYNTVDAAFSKVWHSQFVTWTVADRMELIFKGLDIMLPADEMNEIVKLHEEMELEFRPDFIEGVGDAIAELHKTYKLGVISDAIFSPGRVLRELLKGENLLQYFDHFVFSDEIGHSKPQPIVFESAYKNMGVQPHEMIHIGDREHNDTIGPKNVGVGALLCLASLNRGSENTKADAIFSNYKELPSIVNSLNQSS